MNNNTYSKGGTHYKAANWLLNNYRDMRYLNVDGDIGGGVNREKNDIGMVAEDTLDIGDLIDYAGSQESKMRRMRMMWDGYNTTISEKIVKGMDSALRRLGDGDMRDAGFADLLRGFYVSKEYLGIPVMERITGLGYKPSWFYINHNKAVERYSRVLWEVMYYYDDSPFCGCTAEQIELITDRMKKASAMHNVGGECYQETVQILKYYSLVNFTNVKNRIRESERDIEEKLGKGRRRQTYDILDFIEIPGFSRELKNWMHSSMMETTAAHVSYIDKCVSQLRFVGKRGKEYERIIRACYMQYRFFHTKWEDRARMLGYSQRMFYCRRKEAISLLSKILWGALSCRHSESPFYLK